jgi:hypothetical protein
MDVLWRVAIHISGGRLLFVQAVGGMTSGLEIICQQGIVSGHFSAVMRIA